MPKLLSQQNTRILEYLYMTYCYAVHLHVMNTENNDNSKNSFLLIILSSWLLVLIGGQCL